MSATPPPQRSTEGTTASPEPGPVLDLSHRRVLIIIGALMLGMFLAALDQTIVSTALPTIVADLHGASHLAWIVVAYLLAVTVSTPLWGKLGDQYGRKWFFEAAIVIFLCGSVLSGLSRTMTELIVSAVAIRDSSERCSVWRASSGRCSAASLSSSSPGTGSSTSTSRSAPSRWWSWRFRCRAT
jgi:MFS family permease